MLRLAGVSNTLMHILCKQLACHVATFIYFFQKRISLYASGDSLINTLLNSIIFLTSMMFTSVASTVDVLSVIRGYMDVSDMFFSGVSVTLLGHIIGDDNIF